MVHITVIYRFRTGSRDGSLLGTGSARLPGALSVVDRRIPAESALWVRRADQRIPRCCSGTTVPAPALIPSSASASRCSAADTCGR
jgi:hypothetical protein